MIPQRKIGECFSFKQKRVDSNDVLLDLSVYTSIKAILVGYNGDIIRYSTTPTEGETEILRPDNYTLQFNVSKEDTIKLGTGDVRLEVLAFINDTGAPSGAWRNITKRIVFNLDESLIGSE